MFFSVQFLSSSSQINIEDFNIDHKELIYEFTEGNLYKYSYGKVLKRDEIKSLKEELRINGFHDCFPIAILNGQKMSMSDALSNLK